MEPNTNEKLTRKERRHRWKEVKKAERAALKERYRYAPFLLRWWRLYLWKPVLVLAVIAVLVVLLAEPVKGYIIQRVREEYFANMDLPLSEEDLPKLYELSPIDEEGAARIDAYPAAGEDETWTICVYFVASDLEDMDENDLSYVTRAMTQEIAAENKEKKQARRLENLMRFDSELNENGLELPGYFYYPEKPVASSTVLTEDVTVADFPGLASTDIEELTADQWSDRISIVIQTGGATRWSNQMVNPNRTQRFLYKNGDFSEVADLPLSPAADPDTLSDFLRFCREEYPADHTMLVLWDHGGGPFGYGSDSICGGGFSLKDIREALSAACTPDRDAPPYDIIGFDACLMSSIEVTHALDGFARFYCLSEETIPGNGWDYTPFLEAMSADPSMSPARVARAVADSYTDFYMREDVNQSMVQHNVTFSVIDGAKSAELYDAYSALCAKQLADAAENLGVLAQIGRCAGRSTRYAGSACNVFNTVDLGGYMDQLADSYPEECSRVKELIGESVLYHRENGALDDSTGIAVYVPVDIASDYGLLYYLDYIYDVCEDDNVAALYYYKQAGCLPEEMKETLAGISDAEPKILDVTPFRQFGGVTPEYDEEGFMLPVSEQLQDLIVSYELETGLFDESDSTILYFGREDCLYLDGEGHLASDFDGRWICMDDQPLYLEIVSSAPSATEYRAHVLYNGRDAYLQLSMDNDTEEISLTGVRIVPTNEEAAANFQYNTRSAVEIEPGAKITPVYKQQDLATNTVEEVLADQITFGARTTVQLEVLPEGLYLNTAVISDPRGEKYYSPVIAADIDKDVIQNWRTDYRFYGRDY